MKKTTFQVLALFAAAISIVSCNKSEPYVKADNAFLYNEVKYNTLQDAVDAAVARDSDDSIMYHEITLLTNTSGPGAVIPESFYEYISLDLGSNEYVVTDGGTIDISNAALFLSGSGGRIVAASSSKPLLHSLDGEIILNRNVSLSSAGEVIRTNSNVSVESDFTGKISGDIAIVQNTKEGGDYFNFDYSAKGGSMEIGRLVLSGKSATFDVTETLAKSGAISIRELKADSPYALSAIDKNSVKLDQGGSVHIHNWVQTAHHDKTCVSDEETYWHCDACNQDMVTEIPSAEEGRCPVDSLVHHKAVAPSEFAEGNVEFWECPLCGAMYADSKAQKKLEAFPFLAPLYESDYDQWVIDYDQFFEEEETKAAGAVLGTLANVASVVGAISSVTSTTEKFITDHKKVELLKGIQSQLAAISKEMGDVKSQLINNSEKLAAQRSLSNRWQAVNGLWNMTENYWNKVVTIMDDQQMSKEQITEALRKQAKSWHDEAKVNTYKQVTDALDVYYDKDKLFNSIPVLAEIFQNNKQIWEHQGYGWRTSFNAVDIGKMAVCSEMELLYQELVYMKENKAVATDNITAIKTKLAECQKVYKADSVRMSTRNQKYRVLVTGARSSVFDIAAKEVNLRNWFLTHKDRRMDSDLWTYKHKYCIGTIDQMMSDLGMADFMNYVEMRDACYPFLRDKKQSAYVSLCQAGFTNIKPNYNLNKIILESNDGFKTDNNKLANLWIRSDYKVIHWEIKADLGKRGSQVEIRTILNDSCAMSSLPILKDCKIPNRTEDVGKILDYGTCPDSAKLLIIKRNSATDLKPYK